MSNEMDNTVIREDHKKLRNKLSWLLFGWGYEVISSSDQRKVDDITHLLDQAEKRGRLKQTRRIKQHEIDVWGDTGRNRNFYKAEINQLTKELEVCDCVLADGACETHSDKDAV